MKTKPYASTLTTHQLISNGAEELQHSDLKQAQAMIIPTTHCKVAYSTHSDIGKLDHLCNETGFPKQEPTNPAIDKAPISHILYRNVVSKEVVGYLVF